MDTNVALNMVPFNQAMNWTAAWQNNTDPSIKATMNQIQSFRFDKVDFSQILAKPTVDSVRAYPAIRTLANGNKEVTLLVVGVDEFNTDIIDQNELSADSGIYDFAAPCPNTCGTSPLNHTATT